MKNLTNIAVILVLILFGNLNVTAGEKYVSIFSGRYSDSSLLEDIMTFNKLEMESARLFALSYGEEFDRRSGKRASGYEVQIGKWFDEQTNYELNVASIYRWREPPWEKWVDSSVAVCNGLSFANKEPELEARFEEGGSARLLYYLCIESVFKLPKTERLHLQVRIHHRSGVFGLFSGVNGGSNSLTMGLRYVFD